MRMLAVDPGDVHVGMAEFKTDENGLSNAHASSGWFCSRVWETDPNTGIDTIASFLMHYEIDVLVVEEFRLYPDKAMAQTGSTMPTCEIIGCIKWAHRLDSRRRHDLFHEADDALDRWDDEGKPKRGNAFKALRETRGRNQNAVDLILQPAAVQQPTAGVLRKRGIKSLAKQQRGAIQAAGGVGDHALSAELHGWHWILRPPR